MSHIATYAVAATLASSLVSLGGGILLIVRADRVRPLLPALTAFAAGVLLATAFLDLLPEAETRLAGQAFTLACAGFLAFFVLERLVRSVHSHNMSAWNAQPSSALIMIGDTIHNAMDGAVIAGAFMVSTTTGIAAAITVAVHEIPQEIGDFAVLLHNGLRPRTVLLLNVWSATAAIIGAVVTLVSGQTAPAGAQVIAVTAGLFIYVAAADLMPQLQQHNANVNASWLLGGAGTVWLLLRAA